MSYVEFAGPDAAEGYGGDEEARWTVAVCDDDGEPVDRVHTVSSYDHGLELAQRMARDRRLPLEIDAIRA